MGEYSTWVSTVHGLVQYMGEYSTWVSTVLGRLLSPKYIILIIIIISLYFIDANIKALQWVCDIRFGTNGAQTE